MPYLSPKSIVHNAALPFAIRSRLRRPAFRAKTRHYPQNTPSVILPAITGGDMHRGIRAVLILVFALGTTAVFAQEDFSADIVNNKADGNGNQNKAKIY